MTGSRRFRQPTSHGNVYAVDPRYPRGLVAASRPRHPGSGRALRGHQEWLPKRWYNRIIGMRANDLHHNSMTLTDEEGNLRTIPLILGAARDKRLHSAQRRSYPILLRIAGISGGRRNWPGHNPESTRAAFPSMAR